MSVDLMTGARQGLAGPNWKLISGEQRPWGNEVRIALYSDEGVHVCSMTITKTDWQSMASLDEFVQKKLAEFEAREEA